MRLREQKVDGLGLVAVVAVVGYRAFRFERNVSTDGWATERTSSILGLAHLVGTIQLLGFSKVIVRLKFLHVRLTINALGCIPVLDVVFNAVGKVGAALLLALA